MLGVQMFVKALNKVILLKIHTIWVQYEPQKRIWTFFSTKPWLQLMEFVRYNFQGSQIFCHGPNYWLTQINFVLLICFITGEQLPNWESLFAMFVFLIGCAKRRSCKVHSLSKFNISSRSKLERQNELDMHSEEKMKQKRARSQFRNTTLNPHFQKNLC